MLAINRSGPVWSPQATVVSLIAVSWGLMIAMIAGGHTHFLAHHSIVGHRIIPEARDLLIFIAAWQVMTGAMMLPSSLPLIQMFIPVSQRQVRPKLALTVFLGAYFLVWTAFAITALFADAGLHALVDQWDWLSAHEYLITGAVLVGAGAFQFSSLKERCLDACSSPAGFLFRHYRRGTAAAWSLGIRHGLFCLGCCWALMLVMFALGIGSIAGMAGLTGIMVAEKAFPWGRKLAPVVGIGLIGLGLAILVAPGSMPSFLVPA